MFDARKFRAGTIDPEFAQNTRNDIGHAILAHPEECASLGEIHYLVGKNKSTIKEHINKLNSETSYLERFETSEAARDEPSVFYGLTEEGEIKLDEELDEQKLEEYEQAFEDLDGHWSYSDEKMKRYLEADRPK